MLVLSKVTCYITSDSHSDSYSNSCIMNGLSTNIRYSKMSRNTVIQLHKKTCGVVQPCVHHAKYNSSKRSLSFVYVVAKITVLLE